MDLTPFGIDCVLSKDTNLKSLNASALLRQGSSNAFLGQPTFFILEDIRYNVVSFLGEGTYGATYHVKDLKGHSFALKVLHKGLNTKEDIQVLLKECMIQLVLAEVSKDEPDGPYVPRLYEVAYNDDTRQAFIRSELMRNSLEDLILSNSPTQNNHLLPDAIIQITKQLDFFGKTVQFSHRDLKGDNIMYIKKEKEKENKRIFKLIDFGLSCLTFHGLTIQGGDYFPETGACFKQSRDIMQFLYYLVIAMDKLIDPIFLAKLKEMLVATIAAHDCRMGEQCPTNGLTDWKTSYNFLNRNNLSFSKGSPKKVRSTMRHFQKNIKAKKRAKTIKKNHKKK